MPQRIPRRLTVVLLSLGALSFARASESNYVGMDFAQLMKVKVTSVEMRAKPLATTPAATTILSAEDIRRSGATTIPDLLRTVPGLSVARNNGNTWSISSRGGIDPDANKLLVLIDGRSVYSPLFTGVFWEVQDIPLSSIERIEIIRGPGGSVWGANAVNGVINIIRKTSEAQQGTRVSLLAGNEDRFIGNVQTGWKVGEKTSATAYGRYREFDGLRTQDKGDAGDSGDIGGGGFRLDGVAGERTQWTLSGDLYSGQFYQTDSETSFNPPANIRYHDEESADGGNVLTRITHDMGGAGTLMFQTYGDRTRRRVPRRYSEVRNTWDVVGQHQIALGRVHRLTWGAGFRTSHDTVGNTDTIMFLPSQETEDITNIFAQDEMQLARTWSVIVGSKLERNIYTGWEFQPSARTSWEFLPRQVLWSAVSRAVRTPSRLDRDVKSEAILSATPLISNSIRGSDDFVSERLTAYEIGYRGQLARNYVASLSGFYNVYDHLRGVKLLPAEFENEPAPPHPVIPFVIQNDLRADTYGAEFGQRVQLADWWQIRSTYALLHQRIHLTEAGTDLVANNIEGADPVHQVTARSSWNVGSRVELDLGGRWISKLRTIGVDDYNAFDARAAYKASPEWTIEAVGQNIFDRYHQEISPGEYVERAYFLRSIWQFR